MNAPEMTAYWNRRLDPQAIYRILNECENLFNALQERWPDLYHPVSIELYPDWVWKLRLCFVDDNHIGVHGLVPSFTRPEEPLVFGYNTPLVDPAPVYDAIKFLNEWIMT